MNKDLSGWAFGTGLLVTILLAVSSAVMIEDPPSPADAAVGKGLLVLGCCTALITLVVLGYAISAAPRPSERPLERSDWDDV
ncbi:hypothetical protein [Nocardioides caricicola]|uniref:Amino acid transporter n=1 Tax=Nocardioides caricicola TaxID=634770 RepID=A0ABW0N609_9ACTN